MARFISMTLDEIQKNYDVEEAIAMAQAAPEEKELPFIPGPVLARGFAEFKEYINGESIVSALETRASSSTPSARLRRNGGPGRTSPPSGGSWGAKPPK